MLHVRATNYHLFAECMVNIEVLDANDCPPQFSETNYTVYVQVCANVVSNVGDLELV